jgi:sec-independent protein translocase protein TatB
MLSLSPAKIMIVLVVALLLLGPDKLPQASRQIGAAWRELRHLHQRMETGVRENLPDLPSTQDIARLARSPVALLNRLADMHPEEPTPAEAAASQAEPITVAAEGSARNGSAPPDAFDADGAGVADLGAVPAPRAVPPLPDDPSMN